MYSFNSTSDYTISPENNQILPAVENYEFHSSVDHYWPFYGSDDLLSVAYSVVTDSCDNQLKINGVDVCDNHDDEEDTIKDKIASHPSYSKLLDAYIYCQKIGAPPEIACLLDDIRLKNDVRNRNATSSTCFGADSELDEFMENFWHILMKYKSDLARPFDEATAFLGNIETQLRNLGKDEGDISSSSSEDEISNGETDSTHLSQELKNSLLLKFGGRISSLKHEFTKKKKKKGKLPKEAKQTLLEWWSSHYNWPYPTEGDKISLEETTGLDLKQINNWFINQRKRHWKPSESMKLAIVGSGGLSLPAGQYLHHD